MSVQQRLVVAGFIHLRLRDGVVTAVSAPAYAWALGCDRAELVRWLGARHLPWYVHGWKPRRGEVLIEAAPPNRALPLPTSLPA